MKDWLKETLAFLWIPILLIVLGGLGWLIFGQCTTQRCIDSQNFMHTLIQQEK